MTTSRLVVRNVRASLLEPKIHYLDAGDDRWERVVSVRRYYATSEVAVRTASGVQVFPDSALIQAGREELM